MSLKTPLFLFLFLPAAVLLHLAVGKKGRNIVLLIFSLVFLVFCDPIYFPLILALVLVNYLFGVGIHRAVQHQSRSRWLLILVLVINIGILFAFKLAAAYFPQYGSPLLASIPGFPLTASQVSLVGKYILIPVGLSFFTFQVISFQVDIFKGTIPAEKNLLRFGLYLLMFPRLIAGPIMRLREVNPELQDRQVNLEGLAAGARRFIRGLAKKVLIADQLAAIDQGIFTLTSASISTPIAWLSLISFSLRIYFDFSGYTDMALGIGEMLGFRFSENFNYPYISRSLTEFWRRWHMTLSGWFREYVFYPLERRRGGKAGWLQTVNILIVFLLTGLWHGVTLNFILWGLFQGVVISIESAGLGAILKKQHPAIQHLYGLSVIALGWMIFASPSPSYTLTFFRSMIGLQGTPQFLSFYTLAPVQPQAWLALIFGVLLSFPFFPNLAARLERKRPDGIKTFHFLRDAALIGLFLLSLLVIASSTYQAYIYGRF